MIGKQSIDWQHFPEYDLTRCVVSLFRMISCAIMHGQNRFTTLQRGHKSFGIDNEMSKRKKYENNEEYLRANLERVQERRRNSKHIGNQGSRWDRLRHSNGFTSDELFAKCVLDR